MLLFNFGLYGQSFVIGEPKGILNKLIIHYKQTENVGDNVIIDVEVKQVGDTNIFCLGKFKEASDIFLCLPSAIYKKGSNYIFVKNGSECYFSLSEPYIKFIYDLSSKYTRLNISIKAYNPLKIVYTDKIMSVGGDFGNYTWNWYYVVQFELVKWKKADTDHYSTCSYGGE
jgi:hypothetical protein